MAATKLIAMHVNKGKSAGECLSARLKYARDEEKTDEGEYVTSYECIADIAEKEFLLDRNEYLTKTGREYKGDIIAYQIRQSFKPGEITPEEANAIGYETAMRFTKGQHAFVCCTHVDKAHIHNHVIFNSVNLDCDRKFRDSWFCGIGLMHLSDIICLEHGLSVIEPYKNKGEKPRYEKTYRQKIRDSIDGILQKDPKSFDVLLQELSKEGYELKRGKHLAIRGCGRKNFVRFDFLGEKYTDSFLKKQLDGNSNATKDKPSRNFDLLIDIQEKIKQGKGKGYVRWSQNFNNKAIMNTLLYLNEKGIRSYDQLKSLAESSAADFRDLTAKIKVAEGKIDELSDLRKQIRNFARTKDVFDGYKKSGFSQKYLQAHSEDIVIYKAARKALEPYGGKLPKVKDLSKEIDALVEEKSKCYKDYKTVRDENKKLQEAKRNVEMFLQLDTPEKDQQKKRNTPTR
ncbi:MAG: relaxase/mobilization nuclease domain-containing protein [Butyrivibrio sp.]|nr:relaxase/mobilization nuclease domain-containing protein [Butyrivibrio sp.]